MKNLKQTLISMGIAAGAASSVLLSGSPAQALTTINFDPTIATGANDFNRVAANGTSTFSTTALSTSTVNITGGTGGFRFSNPVGSGFFTSDFLLLGHSNPNATIAVSSPTPITGTSQIYSDPFTVPVNIDPLTGLTISFSWAFNGTQTATPPATITDSFTVELLDYDSTLGNGTLYTTVTPLTRQSYGSGTSTLNITTIYDVTNDLIIPIQDAPGQYVIQITLNEPSANGAGNSAAGFNNITVTFDQIPFDFSATPGLLILGGIFGGSYLIKRLKQRKLDQE